MRKIAFLFMFLAVTILSLHAQKVSNYTYHLANGINIKTEKCWNNIWVDQRLETLKAGDQLPLAMNVRTLGDFSAGSSFKLFSGGKEVKVQGAKPGTYTVKMTYKLSGKPGTLTFDIDDVAIKAGNKTTVNVTLYEYQVLIDETPGTLKGLAGYESKIFRYTGNIDPNLNKGIPSFYPKGNHEKALNPDEKTNDFSGKIKPGTYDVLVSIECPLRTQKVWLENFTMKPDVSYKISTNMNGGVISYAGGSRDVKAIHLYPAGTSSRQTGPPAPNKSLEIIKYDNPATGYFCPPGSYDVLLNHNNGAKYEWRTNIIVKTGGISSVK